jgi:hypothetical protein
MRTSLNDIQHAEKFLTGKMDPAESLLFRAKMLIDPSLRLNVSLLKKTYSVIRFYGRKKMKSDVQVIHVELFNNPDKRQYHQDILKLFSKS